MILRHRVALNGAQLDEVDDRIVIQGITEEAGKDQLSAVSVWGGSGSRLTGGHRDSIDIKITFALRIKPSDMPARSELFDKVNAWAAKAHRLRGGAWMTVNYKENRRLFVILAQAPGAGDQKNWAGNYELTFRAYGVPYWQEIEPDGVISLTEATASGSGRTKVAGSAQTQADVTLANVSGMQINTVTVKVGGNTMKFASLGLKAKESLVIDHREDGVLRLRILAADGAYRSCMSARSASSADDFTVMPGTVSASFSADRACRMTVRMPGRFV